MSVPEDNPADDRQEEEFERDEQDAIDDKADEDQRERGERRP